MESRLVAEPRSFDVLVGCQAYFGIDEILSVCIGGLAGKYEGAVYIKEARRSRTLDALKSQDSFKRPFRHFLFVGGDWCFEVIGKGEPEIIALDDQDAALAWKHTE